MDNKETRKLIDDIHTPLGIAKDEVWRRWNDKALRKRVDEFFGNNFFEPLRNGPKGVFSQYIVTSAHDTHQFIKLCNEASIDPLILEYSDDKLVAKNISKYLLGRVFFCDREDIKSLDNIPRITVINFNTEEGERLNKVKTIWGERLVDFHHNILNIITPDISSSIHDFSSWFQKTRALTEYYYLYYLALFLCHGILFDNIELNTEEGNFTRNKILPSLHKIKEIFGVKPLISPLIPLGHEADPFWCCYPEKNEGIMEKYVKEKYNLDIKKHEK
jgi:hypothetical protein